jgi:phosphate transport system substrate-binding protein
LRYRAELEERKLIQFPSMVTAIVPVVNLPGIDSDKLILDGPLFASIMSGEITLWNHESIRALNQNLFLPPTRIKPFVRSDPSGATLAITTYLAKNASKFAKRVGIGESVKWPDETQLLLAVRRWRRQCVKTPVQSLISKWTWST